MMRVRPDVCVIIPTLNESETIGELIEGLGELDDILVRTIIVDDGSTDGTLKIVGTANWWDDKVYLVNRERKRGLGTAIREGVLRSLELEPPPDYIVTMDGDRSHDPKAIPTMVKKCNSDAVIIGSRYVEGGEIRGWRTSRHIISRVANLIGQVLGKIPAKDCTSGFRCYGVDLERAIVHNLEASGFGIQIEMLSVAARQGFQIDEVPIVFTDRENGDSKLNMPQIFKYVNTAFRLFIQTYQ